MTRRYPPRPAPQKPDNPQARVLSGLNAFEALETVADRGLAQFLWHGPGSFVGAGWAGVLVWFRERGFHTYRTLHLFGVWALVIVDDDTTPIDLVIGRRTLSYQAAIYNPESYFALIQHSFQTHYADRGTPPNLVDGGQIAWRARYQADQRLALRTEIHKQLASHCPGT